MKKAIILFAAVATGLATALARPPNLVLIFADDLGWKDVGYQGNDFHETPNLDRLATQGMVFSAAYAGAGNCAPSRACLLSGNYTPRHHVYAVQSTDRGPKEFQRLVPIPNRSGLAKDNVTMADALKAAGYATGIFGKWHLDGPEGAEPGEQGFDTVHQSYHGWGEEKAKDATNPKGIFSLTKGASEFMEKNRDRPFFVYLPHYAIHTALEAKPETLEKFKRKKPGVQHSNALYAACLHDLDAGVGLLLAKLAELGLERDTLVVFTSDNGGLSTSEGSPTSNRPLRAGKGWMYEGGIRVPLIVRWPGVARPGSVVPTPVSSPDFFPTFLAAAGIAPPVGPADGRSLVPVLRGEAAAERALFWHYPHYGNQGGAPSAAVRRGDWKLISWLEDGREELFHLGEDLGEQRDLAAREPARAAALRTELRAWQQDVGARFPLPNPAYDPAAPSGRAAPRKQ